MINLGVIGYGYWGPNIARNFNLCEEVRLQAICDLDENRRKLAQSAFPQARIEAEPEALLRSDKIEAVAIATPVSTHYPIARAALEAGKHIFIEKPFTASSGQAEDLINVARKKGLLIMVDHTFLFTGAVAKIREIIDSKELGTPFFYDSVRVNLGLFQHDVNVIWDLAPHDFAIMNYLIRAAPVAISAQGIGHFGNGTEDVAFIAVHFDDPFIAHFHCNWLSPVKVRKTMISGDKKMLIWDDLAADEKIKIYDRGVEFKTKDGIHSLLVSYRSGDMYSPKISDREALRRETEYFVDCLSRNIDPINNGEAGLQVVRMLETAEKSIKNGGGKYSL